MLSCISFSFIIVVVASFIHSNNCCLISRKYVKPYMLYNSTEEAIGVETGDIAMQLVHLELFTIVGNFR